MGKRTTYIHTDYVLQGRRVTVSVSIVVVDITTVGTGYAWSSRTRRWIATWGDKCLTVTAVHGHSSTGVTPSTDRDRSDLAAVSTSRPSPRPRRGLASASPRPRLGLASASHRPCLGLVSASPRPRIGLASVSFSVPRSVFGLQAKALSLASALLRSLGLASGLGVASDSRFIASALALKVSCTSPYLVVGQSLHHCGPLGQSVPVLIRPLSRDRVSFPPSVFVDCYWQCKALCAFKRKPSFKHFAQS